MAALPVRGTRCRRICSNGMGDFQELEPRVYGASRLLPCEAEGNAAFVPDFGRKAARKTPFRLPKPYTRRPNS